MSPFQIVNLNALIAASTGRPEVVIGIIDGPVESTHPDLQEARLRKITAGDEVTCQVASSFACQHGTFVTGMLCAKRGSQAPAICSDCTVLVRPIFCEAANLSQCPEVTSDDLALALTEIIDAGAKVVNLSLGLANTAINDHSGLKESFNYAVHKGVLIVASSGNQGRVGHNSLFDHPWVVPVVACDSLGRMQPGSNIGPSIGKRGLMAPGVEITSTSSNGGYIKMTGTSVAAPFVTGAIALLWSLYPEATAKQIYRAVLLPGVVRKSIVPPLLDAESSWRALRSNK